MKKLTAKRIILLILALLIIAAACWFAIPRQVLRDGETLQSLDLRCSTGQPDLSDTDADTLAAAIGGLHYRPCFLESIPNTVPDWDLTFNKDNGSAYRIEVYSDDMVILTARSISYRVTDAAPLLEALSAIG